jgi:RNA-binding protein
MMKQLTGPQNRHLKILASTMKPIIQIGKNGVSDNLITTIDKALTDHELIKVKFLEYKSERRELAKAIAERTSSELLQVIGNTAVFYRESSDTSKRQKLLRKKTLPPPRKKIRRTSRG